MRIGVCTDYTKLGYIKSLGYDFAEFSLNETSALSEEQMLEAQKEIVIHGIKVEAFNNFCPPSLKLSANIDLEAIRAYCERNFERAKRLGGEVIVVGSGGARQVPEGVSQEEAQSNFASALNVIADVAAKYGLKIAIEPLNRYEVNLINTLEDAALMAKKVDREEIGYIVDLYHFYRNGEDFADIAKYGAGLFHTHLARMNEDRGAPAMEDIEDVRKFISALQASGYDGRMSLECTFRPDLVTAVAESAKVFAELNK